VHGKTLPDAARSSLEDLAAELPEVAQEMAYAIRGIEDVLSSFRNVLRDTVAQGASQPTDSIRDAVTLLRSMAKGIEIDFNGPERLPKVMIGQTELTQVLINLGGNAIQAVPRNALGRVTILATAGDGRVDFAVADNGPGMSAEILAKIGTPFFTTRDEGTGLGVSACRRLVANAGGDFRLESMVGRGTTVHFSIPFAE
jgi:signal transduction histidine kinase